MEIEAEVVKIIKEVINRDLAFTIVSESRLREDIEIDSLDTVMLIGDLEDVFEISIDETIFTDICTVGDMVQKIQESLAMKAGL